MSSPVSPSTLTPRPAVPDIASLSRSVESAVLDPERLAILASTGLLDSVAELAFDRITRLAARVLRAPVSLVSLVDRERQFFKSAVGLPEPWASKRETPLTHSFCQHVVHTRKPLIVENATFHPLVRDNLAVRDLGVVAYAGAPLITPDGAALGALCVIDGNAREWTPDELALLDDFAALVSTEIEIRRTMAARIQAMDALRVAETNFRQFLDCCPAVAFCKDLEGRFTYVNRKMVSYFPDAPTWIGRTTAELFPAEVLDDVLRYDREALSTPGGIEREEAVPTRDGRMNHWLTYKFPLTDAQGTTTLAGMSVNITDRKAAEQELVTARDAAQAANVAKGRFLAHMSHEIRTPLTAMLGYADLLHDADITHDERLDFAQTISRNGHHLLEVINDILDFSKIDAHALAIEHIDTDISALLNGIITLLSPRAAEKNIHLSLDITSPLAPAYLCDPTRLRQILLNLIGNALKFTRTGGVTVRVTPSGTNLRIDVTDTGIGMSPEQLAALFKPFFQGDESFSRVYGGTGLGLAISERLARLFNGTLSATSAPGQGSTFTLELPLSLAPSASTSSALLTADTTAATSAPQALAGTVLVAEDCPDNQRLLAFFLKNMGLTVDLAATGPAAIARALELHAAGRPPSLILMDVQLPEIDGYTAIRTLRSAGYTAPIATLTAHALPEDRAAANAAGADAFLTKPLIFPEFIATVTRLVSTATPKLPTAA